MHIEIILFCYAHYIVLHYFLSECCVQQLQDTTFLQAFPLKDHTLDNHQVEKSVQTDTPRSYSLSFESLSASELIMIIFGGLLCLHTLGPILLVWVMITLSLLFGPLMIAKFGW